MEVVVGDLRMNHYESCGRCHRHPCACPADLTPEQLTELTQDAAETLALSNDAAYPWLRHYDHVERLIEAAPHLIAMAKRTVEAERLIRELGSNPDPMMSDVGKAADLIAADRVARLNEEREHYRAESFERLNRIAELERKLGEAKELLDDLFHRCEVSDESLIERRDALDATPQPDPTRFICPDCGPALVDPDGCCHNCGADTVPGREDG